jgi:murein L,D-transpeptidase YafK
VSALGGVDPGALNPNSRFHLSFNLGFPNAYDRSLGRTGSFLMVHGNCVSVGCYAMTDPVIEEIYVLVEAALNAGQRTVPVHAFPFRMTDQRMQQARGSEWFGFWQQLWPVYQAFETTQQVPNVVVLDQGYGLAPDQAL